MTGTSALIYSVVSAVVGFALTLGARLMDKFLPDPEDEHPMPELPDLNADGKPG